MSVLDQTIEKLGSLYSLKTVIESTDDQGYSTKSVVVSQVKCVVNELTGLEQVWDIAGVMHPGDIQVYFKSKEDINPGDILEDEDKKEWEIVQVWKRKWLNQIQCLEAIGRSR